MDIAAPPAPSGVLRLPPGDPRHPALRREGAAAFRRATVTVLGDAALLDRRLVGFFCSREAPPAVTAALGRWVDAMRDFGSTVAGGFHAPPERGCLEALVGAGVPVVVCPARGVGDLAPPDTWHAAMAAGRLTVVSPFGDVARRTSFRLASRRNGFVAALADAAVVAHAAPGGWLFPLVRTMVDGGLPVWTFALPENAALLAAGARPWPDV